MLKPTLFGVRLPQVIGLGCALALMVGGFAPQLSAQATPAPVPMNLTGMPHPIGFPQVNPSSVKVTPTSVAVMTGRTAKLSATVSPSGASQSVTWSSAKTATATVSSTGVVTGKISGKGKSAKVTITAKTKTLAKTATATVQVYTTHDVQARLNTLACKDASNKALVVDGKYGAASTAAMKKFQKAAGRSQTGTPDSATLIAMFASNAAKCTATSTVAVTGVTLSPTSAVVMSGKTVTLTPTVSPSNASKAVTWTSASTGIATVSSTGVVTGKVTGTGKSAKTTITVKTSTGSKTATAQVQVYTGQDVQARINALGCKDANGKALVVDGILGTNSANGLKNWQKAAGRSQTGSPDGATLTALFASSAAKCTTTTAPTTPPTTPTTPPTTPPPTDPPTTEPAITDPSSTPSQPDSPSPTGDDTPTPTQTPTGTPTTPTPTTAPTSTSASPTISLSGGMTVKNPLNQGTAVTVTGTITSTTTIKSVSAVIATKDGVTAFSCSASPNATKYSLSPCDSPLKFSQLIPGDYVYTVKATNGSVTNQVLVSQAFTVKSTSSIPGFCIPYAQAKTADDQYPVPADYKGKGTMDAFVNIAKSQIGYREGTYAAYAGCVWFPTTADSGNWTKYGAPYSLANGNGGWCAAFVSWSARQAGLPTSTVLDYVSTTAGVNWYKAQKDATGASRFHANNGSYTPKPGDVIFYYSGGSWYHTGLVASYDASTGKLTTIEGNSSDQVSLVTRSLATTVSIGGFGSNS